MDNITEKRVYVYKLPNGQAPYIAWLEKLRDDRAKQKIQTRIGRIRIGNLGQTRSLGSGVHELIVDYGPGYRIYFGQDGNTLVILLCGGDKHTQHEDIQKAKDYWKDYRQDKTHVIDS